MAGDRTAELLIKSRMESGDVTEKTRAIRNEIERAGDAADGTAAELQQAAVAVTNLGHAEQATATETAEVARALEVAGQAAVEMGADAAQGANAVTIAIEEVSAAAREEAAALEATGRASAEAAEKSRAEIARVTAALREQFDAIRASGNPYAQRLAALQAYETELQDVARGEKANTDLSRAHAEASAAGLTELRQHIREVTTEIERQASKYPELSAAARAAIDGINGPAVTLESRFINAASAITKANTEIAETGRIGPRALGFAAQAVESYREAIIRQHGSVTAARAEEIAQLEVLETHLRQLTATGNRLTNAAKDNAVRLKESGAQIAGLAGGVQNLTQLLGPHAAGLSLAAGNAAILASTYESLKDDFAALNLNTLSAGAANKTLAIQILAVVAAAVAGIAAGGKLAETNKQNAETIDDLKESLFGAAGATDKLTAALDAGQRGFQDVISDLDLILQGNLKATSGISAHADSFKAYLVALTSGSAALRVYNDLVQQGFARNEAARIATDDARRATEAFTLSQQLGKNGAIIWQQAVRDAGGSAAAFTASLDALKQRLEFEIKILQANAVSQRENSTARTEGTSVAAAQAEGVRHAADAIADATAKLDAHTAATESASAVIRALLDAINQETGARDAEASAIGRAVSAAREELAANQDLNEADKARLEAVIRLGADIDALTEKKKKAVEQEGALTKATKDAATATRDHAASLREIGTATDQSLAATSASFDSFLAESEAFFARSAEAAGENQAQISVIHGKQIEQIDSEIAAKKTLLEIIAKEQGAVAQVAAAHGELHKVLINGKEVLSNLSEEERKAGEELFHFGDKATNATTAYGTLTGATDGAKMSITNLGTAAETTGGQIETAQTKTSAAAIKVLEDLKKFEVPAPVLDSMERLAVLVERIEDGSRRATPEVAKLAGAIDESGKAAGRASGGTLTAPAQ